MKKLRMLKIPKLSKIPKEVQEIWDMDENELEQYKKKQQSKPDQEVVCPLCYTESKTKLSVKPGIDGVKCGACFKRFVFVNLVPSKSLDAQRFRRN